MSYDTSKSKIRSTLKFGPNILFGRFIKQVLNRYLFLTGLINLPLVAQTSFKLHPVQTKTRFRFCNLKLILAIYIVYQTKQTAHDLYEEVLSVPFRSNHFDAVLHFCRFM